ncbi:hypothetical protein SAMN05660748_0987 [Blastococcus aggregatus]|uniref:Glycosyltransferase, GT2 family n=1 Tax=Blastococcus aggregatus TaxID=38502 RepID=A0A285V0Z4_9ACTN|nr:hypothetical protein [Blastococcus aggregatus]SOC47730.1 hypothetical protein SAMN05660748_0987 [Blastococcus aggregatus]
MTTTLVVSPSVTASHAARFCATAAAAIAGGADLRAVLVANSAETQALAAQWPDIVVPGSNAGFAASINLAAAGRSFRWLVVANDDMEFVPEAFEALAAHLAGEPDDRPHLIRLTDEPWRHLPGTAGVFAGLSLVEKVAYGLGRPLSRESTPREDDVYPSFGLVAISARLWQQTNGMEEQLPFCYEDAWFVRQARAAAPDLRITSFDLGVPHALSSSTGAKIHLVLPVIAWSAVVYLQLLGVPPLRARAVCLAALVIRAPLSLAGTANRRRHLLGIGRSVWAIVTDRRPSLPAPTGPAPS